MSVSCVASIDQGTSSTRVLLVCSKGTVLSTYQIEHTQHYPVAGQVEHDPLEIWNSVKICLSGALEACEKQVNIVAIGITNQRETTVVWNKNTGKPYHRAIVWNDTRTEQICEKMSQKGGKDKYRKSTGLPIAPYFSASKLVYLLTNVPGLREAADKGDALFGTIDTWLMWKLTNGAVHSTDVTNASRTLLMNLRTLQWDKKILEELDIPLAMLPDIHASSYLFGYVDTAVLPELAHLPLPAQTNANRFEAYQNVAINGVIGDQNAALFGQGCFNSGESKCTYGTGAFMLFNTGNEILQSRHGLLTTVAYQLAAKANNYSGTDIVHSKLAS
jgi:glycerol kinase